jgi:predicted MFS family arabinose efflux permease
VTWNSSIFEVSSMAGPALAGLVIAIWSPMAAYVLSACFTLAFVYFLLLLHQQPKPAVPHASHKGELMAGIRFVWRTKLILATITMDLFAVLLGGATFLIPVFSRDILHVGPVGFGWLRAAPSLGAVAMAVFLAHRGPMKHAGLVLLWAVAGFGLATILFGLSRWFWLSMFALFLTGSLDNISVVVRHTLVQLLTPDSMRGRVSAVNAVFIGASNELGGFESGLTAAIFGPILSVVGGGIGTILVVMGVALVWPQVRRLGSLHDVRPLETEGQEHRMP